MLGRRKAPWVRSTASPFAGWCGRRPFKAPHAQAWVSPVSRVPRQGLREGLRPSARGDRLPRDRPTYLVPSDVGHRLTTRGVRVDQVGVNPPWRAVAAVGVAQVQSARRTATPGLRQSGWLGSARRSSPPAAQRTSVRCIRTAGLAPALVCSWILSVAEVDGRHVAHELQRIAG